MDLPNRTYILCMCFCKEKQGCHPTKTRVAGGTLRWAWKKHFFSIQSSKKLIISGDPVFLWNLSGQEIQTSRAATPQREFLLLPNWNSIYVMIKPNVSLCVCVYIYMYMCPVHHHVVTKHAMSQSIPCRLAYIEYGTLKTPNPFRKEYCGLPCDFDGI